MSNKPLVDTGTLQPSLDTPLLPVTPSDWAFSASSLMNAEFEERLRGRRESLSGEFLKQVLRLVPPLTQGPVTIDFRGPEAPPVMTEQEWLTSADSAAMLRRYLRLSYRPPFTPEGARLRLFCLACAEITPGEDVGRWRRWAVQRMEWSDVAMRRTAADAAAWWARCEGASLIGPLTHPPPKTVAADLLRCTFGNPWRPVTLLQPSERLCAACGQCRHDACGAQVSSSGIVCGCQICWPVRPHWLTPAVLAVARDVREGRCFGEVGVVADALEEAGCPPNVGECETCQGEGDRIHCSKCRGIWHTVGGPRPESDICPGCTSNMGEPVPAKRKPCDDCRGTGRVPNPLLAHLRGPGAHGVGCWALEQLLGPWSPTECPTP